MSLPSSHKPKVYGVRASMADLARSLAALASMAVARYWFSIDEIAPKRGPRFRRARIGTGLGSFG